jgi:hypothetical protein
MNWIKSKIVGLMTGLAGMAISPLLARGIIWIVSQVEKLDPALAAQINQQEVQQWLMGLVVAAIGYFFTRPVKNGVKVLQAEQNDALPEAEPIPVDGIPFQRTQSRQRVIAARAGRLGGNPAR